MKLIRIALAAALLSTPAFAQVGKGQLVAGSDGTQVQNIKTDNQGRLLVVGSAAGNAVYGPDAPGNIPSQPPVLTAGLDGTNVRTIQTDTAGNTEVVGTVAAGAADSGAPVKVGGVYSSTLPTLTNGQRGNFQVGTRGSQNVTLFAADSTTAISAEVDNADGVAASATTDNLSTISRGTLFNATSWDRIRSVINGQNTTGTGIQAVGALGQLDDTSTGSVTENQWAPVRITSAREQMVSAAPLNYAQGSTTSGQLGNLNFGAVSTTNPSYTNAQSSPLSLTTSGGLRVFGLNDVAQGSTTSGQIGPIVQGAVTTAPPSYTTAQTSPLSLTTSGNLRTLDQSTVAQGSTTSGQVGGLTMGAVTTAAPSYTTAQTSPLSLTVAGSLRVTDTTAVQPVAQGSTTSGQTGPLVQAAVTTSNPSYTTAQTSPLSMNTAGELRVATSQPSSSSVAQVAASASSVTILASNAARKMATIYNDSSVVLYLKLNSGAASTTSYTVQMASQSYYEVPGGYTGAITGIWASAVGNAYVTEIQ